MDVTKVSEKEIINHLIQLCRQSERRILNTAEHIRNRGLKMVLKGYAQQRARFGDELRTLLGVNNLVAKPDEHTRGGLKRGWLDIKAVLTVQRQRRQRMLLRDLVEEDAVVILQYTTALASDLAAPIKEVFERQHQQMMIVHARLKVMAQPGDQHLLVRLFDHADNAQKAIKTMVNAGVSEKNIFMNTVDNVAIYQEQNKQSGWSARETLLTSGLLGLLAGLLLGGIGALFQQYLYPDLVGILVPTRFGAALDLIAGGAVVGTLFALIFGAIIASDTAEDDNYLYENSLEKGNTLVVVIADSTNRAAVEKIIGLRHEFEVRAAVS